MEARALLVEELGASAPPIGAEAAELHLESLRSNCPSLSSLSLPLRPSLFLSLCLSVCCFSPDVDISLSLHVYIYIYIHYYTFITIYLYIFAHMHLICMHACMRVCMRGAHASGKGSKPEGPDVCFLDRCCGDAPRA